MAKDTKPKPKGPTQLDGTPLKAVTTAALAEQDAYAAIEAAKASGDAAKVRAAKQALQKLVQS